MEASHAGEHSVSVTMSNHTTKEKLTLMSLHIAPGTHTDKNFNHALSELERTVGLAPKEATIVVGMDANTRLHDDSTCPGHLHEQLIGNLTTPGNSSERSR